MVFKKVDLSGVWTHDHEFNSHSELTLHIYSNLYIYIYLHIHTYIYIYIIYIDIYIYILYICKVEISYCFFVTIQDNRSGFISFEKDASSSTSFQVLDIKLIK